LKIQAVCFRDFRNFFSQPGNSFFHGLRHNDRLAEQFEHGQSCFSNLVDSVRASGYARELKRAARGPSQ
jgi:hypothetical protein